MKKKEITKKTEEVLPALVPLTDKPLSDEEDKFCELYVSGGPLFAGNHRKCYEEVFGKSKNVPIASRLLLARPHISARIREMIDSVQFDVETIAARLQVAETLKAVMSETSTAEYTDKFGVPLSPAPLRAVAVNAAKALMELYPVKCSQETKLRIDGGEGGVVFNVIVPQMPHGNREEE